MSGRYVIISDNGDIYRKVGNVEEYVRSIIRERILEGVSLSGFDYDFWLEDEAVNVKLYDCNMLDMTVQVYGIEKGKRQMYYEETSEYIENLFRILVDK